MSFDPRFKPDIVPQGPGTVNPVILPPCSTPLFRRDVRGYGAVGDGVYDCTSEFQACLNDIANSSGPGSTLHIPSLPFLITQPLIYSSNKPLFITGEVNEGFGSGSILSAQLSSAGPLIDVTNAFEFHAENFTIKTAGAQPAGSTGIRAGGTHNWISNVNIYDSLAGTANSFDTGLEIASAGNTIVHNGLLSGRVTGCLVHGGQVSSFYGSNFSSSVGNGSGCLAADSNAGTIRVFGSQTQGGDRGFFVPASSNSVFIFFNDFEINDPFVAGIELQAGSQFWGNQVWLSFTTIPSSNLVHGISIGPGYSGFFDLQQSTVQAPTGHGLWVQGGSGYKIVGNSFGLCGSHAANTYDDIHLASAVSQVTMNDNHFDVDPFMGLNTPPARSAINVEAGVSRYNAVGCISAAAGYGTSAVIDTPGAMVKAGNIGFL